MIEGDNVNKYDVFSEWRQCYNYSSMRNGLLSWYDFKAGSRILEVNPQMGALTGLLASKCRELVCVIRSENDKVNLEKRFSHFTNIRLVYSNQIEGFFDYIIAYDPFCYYETGKDIIEYYKEWEKMLSPKGILLLMINNAFSPLACLSAKNSHNRGDSIASLNKELSQIYRKIKCYYVYPDMVFPQDIYTDEYPPNRNIACSVIPYSAVLDNSYEDILEFYKKSFDVMDEKNIAGSFIVECTNDGEFDDVQRVKITSDRRNGMLTVIRKDKAYKLGYDSNRVESVKLILANHEEMKKAGINVVETKYVENRLEMPIIKAPLLKDVLINLSVDEAVCVWDSFVENIRKSSEICKSSQEWDEKYLRHSWGDVLKTGYIEMTPINCFYDDGNFIFFDQEYSMHNCPINFIIFRSIVHVYGENSQCEIVEILKKRYGLNELWDVFILAERDFLGDICDDENKYIKQCFFSYNQFQYYENQRMSVQTIKYLFSDLGNKDIICYGTGAMFKNFMNGYGRICKIPFVVDSNPELWGKSVCGIPIKSPSDINSERHRVVITCQSVEEIKKILLSMDIQDFRYINSWE